MFAQIVAASRFIHGRWSQTPRVGIVLGSGLGGFAAHIAQPTIIPYREIPHFPSATAMGHAGQLVCGLVADVPVITMQGRFHYYEGHAAPQITLPIRALRALGAEWLVVSNASGGVNPHFQVGDIMILDDHINLMFVNPLIGMNDERLGPRFPDLSQPYDYELIDRGLRIARNHDFVAHRGVYAALTGPTYETRAEYRMLRKLGADAVGMSTVPEVLVAVHGGMKVFALSVITNACSPDALTVTTGEEVIIAARSAEANMRQLVWGLIETL